MRPWDSVRSLAFAAPARAIVLTAMATLLAAADWLPENRLVDPDQLEFALTVVLGGAAIVVTLRERMETRQLIAWRNRAILLTLTLALSAALAEFGTRWIFRDVTTSSDNGGYFSRRWYRTDVVRSNSGGFREREFAPIKPAGTYRIAAVGDSFTYGNGVRQQDRYSDVLQARVPDHIEVLNFGRAGANTPEHRQLIETLLRDVHPDFVLLQWYVNDVEDDDWTGRPRSSPLIPLRSLHNWLNDASALYTVMNMQWAETQVALGFTSSYTEYLHRRLADPDGPDAARDRQLLNELITLCKRHGVPIGIVLFPDTAAPLDEHYPFGYLHERVLATCAAQDITCLDLRKDFSVIKERQSLWANRLDHHPSARANAIAAERILETYSPMWVGSPSR